MAIFTTNANRFDPYKNFRFRLKWEGRYIAGISKVSALKRTTEVVEHRDGGDPTTMRKSPGNTKFEPITLERGVTHDTEFEEWASQVWQINNDRGSQIALAGFRRNILLELHNEAGQIALVYKIFRCWVSEYNALPELDANANAVAIQSMILQHEGFVRDVDVAEPTEPLVV
jgi:phage tail-like protein